MSDRAAIYKYPLQVTDGRQYVEMPDGSEIVHVEEQHGVPTLWAKVKWNTDMVLRKFTVVGTGHAFDPDLTHVGTCQIGPFVWHVLEDFIPVVTTHTD